VIRDLEEAGAKLTVRALDVCDGGAVSALIDEIASSGVPLRGLVHAAGVLDDGLVMRQEREEIERVLRPKLLGAWALHEATRELDLDFFVLFSSAVSLLGSPGQGNYTAANAFLDALAHARRACGQVAQSINWGPWSEVGLVADRRFLGLESLAPEQGLRALARVLRDGSPQLGVMTLDLRQWCQLHPSLAELPLFAQLVDAECGHEAAGGATPVRSELFGLPTPAARRARLMAHLQQQIGRVLGREPATIPSDQPLAEMGFDSLMIVELRNRMERSLGVALSAAMIWGHPTLGQLAPELARRMELDLDEPDAEPAAQAADAGAQYDDLSEEEIAALLSTEIQRVRGERA
jgi:aryl carrier-like protein